MVDAFINMLQDKDAPERGSGMYTGARAVNSAKQMAILGSLVSGFIGISQKGRAKANTLIINNRHEKKI